MYSVVVEKAYYNYYVDGLVSKQDCCMLALQQNKQSTDIQKELDKLQKKRDAFEVPVCSHTSSVLSTVCLLFNKKTRMFVFMETNILWHAICGVCCLHVARDCQH